MHFHFVLDLIAARKQAPLDGGISRLSMGDMNLWQATEIATNGDVAQQIRARLAAGSTTDATHARLMVEIAMLALAEAGRVLDDEDVRQESIEAAMTSLEGA